MSHYSFQAGRRCQLSGIPGASFQFGCWNEIHLDIAEIARLVDQGLLGRAARQSLNRLQTRSKTVGDGLPKRALLSSFRPSDYEVVKPGLGRSDSLLIQRPYERVERRIMKGLENPVAVLDPQVL